MNLTQTQFEILTTIERHQDQKHSQRSLATTLEISVGAVNKAIGELCDLELMKSLGNSHYDVTLKGYEWLEPYRVKKAIFMAAGFGSRMVPVTLNTPKPLILVHGKRIIETLVRCGCCGRALGYIKPHYSRIFSENSLMYCRRSIR